ncbi:hypothetical protein FHX15_001466 [Rhizobium sp. BK650]|nr:hypothetical protein [Rhizobium sp. BK650]
MPLGAYISWPKPVMSRAISQPILANFLKAELRAKRFNSMVNVA